MITLSRFDGVTVEVKAGNIVRIRQAEPDLKERGNSRVDGLITPFYDDAPSSIADRVQIEVASFISLNQPSGKPVWFDAAKASGPVFVSSVNHLPMPSGQTRSALLIGGSIQYVSDTPEDVFDAIKKHGGHAEPPVMNTLGHDPEKAGRLQNATPVWDAELYLDVGKAPES